MFDWKLLLALNQVTNSHFLNLISLMSLVFSLVILNETHRPGRGGR